MEKQIDTKKEEKTTHILAMHSVAEHSSTVLRMSKGEFMCECELYAWQKRCEKKELQERRQRFLHQRHLNALIFMGQSHH